MILSTCFTLWLHSTASELGGENKGLVLSLPRCHPSSPKEPPVLAPDGSQGLGVGITLLPPRCRLLSLSVIPSFLLQRVLHAVYCSFPLLLVTAPATMLSVLGWLGAGGRYCLPELQRKERLPSPRHVCSFPSPTESCPRSHSLRKTPRSWACMGCRGRSGWGSLGASSLFTGTLKPHGKEGAALAGPAGT